jgi:hypothetical protein
VADAEKKGLSSGDLPALYQAFSARSDEAQRNVLRAVKASLGGAVAAAVLGLIEINSGEIDLAALVASLGFLISLLASSWLLWQRPEREWYDARAGAESTKTLSWQFAIAGGEFARSDDEAEAQRRFVDRLGEILTGLGTVGTSTAASDAQVTQAMLELRAAPLSTRQEAYRLGRIEDQRIWYAGKAAWNERRRKIWALATVAVQALGLGAGLARAFFGLEVDLLGLAAALVAGITAWARTKDYAELAEAYVVTAQEIGLLSDQPVPRDEQAWADFVEGAERAFSREHTLWRARKGHRQIG